VALSPVAPRTLPRVADINSPQQMDAVEAVALFYYQVKNGSVRSRRHWLGWAHWCLRAALERMRPYSEPGSVMGWDFSAFN